MDSKLIAVESCPVCGNNDFIVIFKRGNFRGKRCLNCQLVYSSPRLPDVKKVYVDDGSSSPSKYYKLSSLNDRRTFNKRLELLEKYVKKGSLLDVGCSVGTLLETAKNRGWRVVRGIEPNPVSAEECRKKNVPVINGFLNDDSIADIKNSYDAVYMGDVIEHVGNPVEFVDCAKKTLKTGGVLMIVTPNFESFIARMFQIKPYEHLLYFNKDSLGYLLRKSGLKIELIGTTTRERSMKALKYSTTFSDKPFMNQIVNIFALPGFEIPVNLFIKFFIRDELVAVAGNNN